MKTKIYHSIKRSNSNQLSPIYCRISKGNLKCEISFGIYVSTKDYCIVNKRIKPSCPMADSFNKRIIQYHSKIFDIITLLECKGIHNPQLVREIFRNKKKIAITDLNKSYPSFTKWCKNYIESKYTQKYNTQRNYLEALNHVIKLEIELKQIITKIDIKTAKFIYDYLNINNRLNYLQKIKFLSKIYHDHFEMENFLQKYKAPNKEKYKKNSLTQLELHKIMKHEPKNLISKVYLDIFLFQYFSAGSRVGDVIRMKWADISNNNLKRVEEKTGKERIIPLNNILKKILLKYQNNESEFVFSLNQPNQLTTNKEWCHYKDRIISGINSCLRTIQKNLLLTTHISSHTSRHTFATHTFETTQDIKATSLLIGHSKLATTEMYIHTSEKLSKELFAKIYKDF